MSPPTLYFPYFGETRPFHVLDVVLLRMEAKELTAACERQLSMRASVMQITSRSEEFASSAIFSALRRFHEFAFQKHALSDPVISGEAGGLAELMVYWLFPESYCITRSGDPGTTVFVTPFLMSSRVDSDRRQAAETS